MYTMFWHDHWIGDNPLILKFPRLFALQTNNDCIVRQRWNGVTQEQDWCRTIIVGTLLSYLQQLRILIMDCNFSDNKDKWAWKLGVDDIFLMAEVRRCIDDHSIPNSTMSTKCNKCLPSIVNIFNWRMRLNLLPT